MISPLRHKEWCTVVRSVGRFYISRPCLSTNVMRLVCFLIRCCGSSSVLSPAARADIGVETAAFGSCASITSFPFTFCCIIYTFILMTNMAPIACIGRFAICIRLRAKMSSSERYAYENQHKSKYHCSGYCGLIPCLPRISLRNQSFAKQQSITEWYFI